ncbi:MAG: hypothetical protein AB9842_09310 [Bacteroidales bacterium]
MRYKYYFFVCLFLVLFQIPTLYAQDCIKAAWVKTFGGNSLYNEIVDGGRTIDGNFVVLGSYGNAALLLDTFTLPATTESLHYYLAIHDTAGNILNAKRIMYGSSLFPNQLAVSPDGSTYITGYWQGTAYVGNDTLPNATRKRVFVAKYNSNLDFQWVARTGWMSADCQAFDITTDLQNHVYITGSFEDNAFKMGDLTVFNRGGYNSWSDDGFVLKLDDAGVIQWLEGIGSYQDEVGRTITADSLGNIWVTGTTQQNNSTLYISDNIAIPGGTGITKLLLTKFRGSDGYCLSARLIGGFSTYERIYPWNSSLGDNNSLILCGEMNGTIQVPPKSFYSSDNNGFVARFDQSGDCEWLKLIGGSNTSEAAYNVTYHNGRIAVSGKLFSNQPYVGEFPLYSTLSGGSFDAFNAQLTAEGKVLWARGNNSSSMFDLFNNCVLIDNDGNQLLWGSFRSSQTWYPHTVSNSSGNYKTFLVRFTPFAPAPAFSVSAGPDKSGLCATNIQLSGSTSPSNIPFGWWPDLGFSPNNTKTPNVQPAMPQDYILYGNYQGCILSDTVHVDLTNYALSLQTLSGYAFCQGDSVQLVASCNDTSAVFNWVPAYFISNTSSSSPWVKPGVSTNYIVTATSGGCVAKDTVQVVHHSKPWIYLPKQDQYYAWWRYHLCQGSPVDFNMGDPANLYTVMTPDVVTNVNNNLATILADSVGSKILNVVAQSPFGCYNIDSVNVIVHNNQAAPIFLGQVYDRSACEGDSIQLNIWITNSILYNFQYSWYGGWEVDSLDGDGWKEINSWENYYESTLYSSGYPNSTYYGRLRIRTVFPDMDGFRYRFYVHDYCSSRAYSNVSTLTVGPKISAQPQNKTLCAGVTDSISVNSQAANAQFFWEVKQNGQFGPLINQPGVVEANGRFLRFTNAQAALDSTIYRCRVEGCNNLSSSFSNPALIRVISQPVVLWQSPDDTICEGTVDSLMVLTNSGPYTFNWYENNTPITYNTSTTCCFNTNKLKFNPVYLYLNNYNFKLRIRNTQCAFDMYSNPMHFTVIPSATVSWPGGDIHLCIDSSPYALSGGSPSGGSYSGPGVTGNIFDPVLVGPGTWTITYTIAGPQGCGGIVARDIVVHPIPEVSWPGGPMEWCSNQGLLPLTGGIPSGGTYSGQGVVGSFFDPGLTGAGVFEIIYTYLDPVSACQDTALRNITVNPATMVSWPGGSTSVCLNSGPYLLSGGYPSGGNYTGDGVSGGIFFPAMAGTGWHLLTYTWMDPLTSCTDSASRNYYVDPCVGIEDHSDGILYLQTNKETITFWQQGYFSGDYEVEVYNLMGQRLHLQRFNGSCNPCGISLDSPGGSVFYLRFSDSRKSIVKKVLNR